MGIKILPLGSNSEAGLGAAQALIALAFISALGVIGSKSLRIMQASSTVSESKRDFERVVSRFALLIDDPNRCRQYFGHVPIENTASPQELDFSGRAGFLSPLNGGTEAKLRAGNMVIDKIELVDYKPFYDVKLAKLLIYPKNTSKVAAKRVSPIKIGFKFGLANISIFSGYSSLSKLFSFDSPPGTIRGCSRKHEEVEVSEYIRDKLVDPTNIDEDEPSLLGDGDTDRRMKKVLSFTDIKLPFVGDNGDESKTYKVAFKASVTYKIRSEKIDWGDIGNKWKNFDWEDFEYGEDGVKKLSIKGTLDFPNIDQMDDKFEGCEVKNDTEWPRKKGESGRIIKRYRTMTLYCETEIDSGTHDFNFTAKLFAKDDPDEITKFVETTMSYSVVE